METDKQDSLSDLGVGKETPSMPRFIQQNIYKQMKPGTSSATTQAKASMAEFETQTHWTVMNSKDMASQAVPDTMDSCMQAKPGMADFGTQAKPSATDFGMQAKPTVADFGSYAKPRVADFGTQVKPRVADFGSEARPLTVESGTQSVQMGVESVDSGVQMTSTDQQTSGHNDQYNTIKVDFSKSELFVIEVNGVTMTLSKEDSAVIQEIVKRAVTKSKFSGDMKTSTGCGVGTDGAGFSDSSTDSHSGGRQMMQGAAAAISNSRPNIAGRPKKKLQGDVIKYHTNVPYEGQLDKYLSPTSPFSEFGYDAHRDTPATLDNIKIPFIDNRNISYEKTGENDSVVLGRGGFGCVYYAKHRMFTIDICVKEFEDDSTTLYDIHHEAQMMLYLQSTKFVPQCLGIMVSPFVSEDVSLVQECFAKGYTLKKLLKNKPRNFIDRKWIAVVYQLFWGLKRIHEKQVLLNDIKTDNVLIDYQSGDMHSNVRFIDMGLSTFRRGHRFSDDPTYMEHCEYHAPEVRQGLFSTPASDLYAVGYMVNTISETIGIIELDAIAQMCTEDDPHDRPSCQYVLEKLEDILEEM